MGTLNHLSGNSYLDEDKLHTPYVLDVPYTWSYFEYQNPLLLSHIAGLNGYSPPNPASSFSYCDLGCGNGVTLNYLAEAFPNAHFVGVDFNPEHIENASQCALQAGLKNIRFFAESFDEYASDHNEKFDYVAMHGIYSWVSEEVREQIHKLLKKILKPGGLVYVSYNCLPGWSPLIPLWKMMQDYISEIDADSLTKARYGLNKIKELRDLGCTYFKDTPSASEYLEKLLSRDISYVAHEFCNGIFEPHYFNDVANIFGDLGMSYAGTAKFHRNDAEAVINPKFHEQLNNARSTKERESRASLIRNEFFRRDIYINKIQTNENRWTSDGLRVGSIVSGQDLLLEVKHRYKTLRLDRDLAELLTAGQFSIRELKKHPKVKHLNADQIENAARIAVSSGQFQAINQKCKLQKFDPEKPLVLRGRINHVLLTRLLESEGKAYLTSPILGGVIRLRFIYALYVKSLHESKLLDARTKVRAHLLGLSDQQRQTFGVPSNEKITGWQERYEKRFVTQKLPVLIKYDILSSISNIVD